MISEICVIDEILYKQDYCVIKCHNKNCKFMVKCDINGYNKKYILFFGEIKKVIDDIIYVEAYECKQLNNFEDVAITNIF